MDDAGLRDVGRKIDERSDDAARIDRFGDHAARIDAFQAQAIELAAVSLEVPPRNPVLRTDDDRVGPEERPQLRGEAGERVRLYSQKNAIDPADRSPIAGDLRLH